MMKGKLRDAKKIVSRFRGKLVNMIKDAGSKFNDHSISPKIRQILLHWGYESTEEDFFIGKKSCKKQKKKKKEKKKIIPKEKLLRII